MNNLWVRNGIRALLLLAADIYLLGELEFTPWVQPHIYFLFILLLPARIPHAALLCVSFLAGFVMDVFTDSFGMHAAAATLTGFVRIFFIPIFLSTEEYEDNITPGMRYFGFGGFMLYAGVLAFIYHLTWFSLEVYKSSYWLLIAGKTIFSTLASLLFVYLIEIAFRRKKSAA